MNKRVLVSKNIMRCFGTKLEDIVPPVVDFEWYGNSLEPYEKYADCDIETTVQFTNLSTGSPESHEWSAEPNGECASWEVSSTDASPLLTGPGYPGGEYYLTLKEKYPGDVIITKTRTIFWIYSA